MRSKRYFYTSESVCMGHPDKVADQISDGVLDAILACDPTGRVACETLVTTGMALVAGEISTTCYVEIPHIVRDTIKEIGYTDPRLGFDYETCAVLTAIDEQSPDISQGVNKGGAGDQGVMFGYACSETQELMPLPIMLAHKLVRRLAEVRISRELDFLWPDGKSQVTVEYEDGRPLRVHTIVIAAHHKSDVTLSTLREEIIEKVIKPIVPEHLRDKDTIYYVNETGRFERGGPQADCGLTGRKIIVDTYGGRINHGGGCFSGKDPTKVDRSASYMARYVAKNVVAAGLAEICVFQLSYAIGVADPLSLSVDTRDTAKIPEDKILSLIREHFLFTPQGMIEHLQLRRPIYKKTACFGHFGRTEPEFTWEKNDLAQILRKAAGL
ncbi:MAG: S-adenosylmethionine synthetase [Planctomycetes bacterium DG_23]|nr:MAG: S-adenosylmethionine synthetase [Planctomycetes bacterium DG_23]